MSNKPLVKIEDLLSVIHVGIDFDSEKRIAEGVKLINTVQKLSSSAAETLIACFERGPLYDGDVPSKTGRDDLLQFDFISKIVMKGEEGYNACTYLGARAYRLLKSGANN